MSLKVFDPVRFLHRAKLTAVILDTRQIHRLISHKKPIMIKLFFNYGFNKTE